MGKQLYNDYREVPKSKWKWTNFSPEEIASNIWVNGKVNGQKVKGPILIDERSLDMLQALRDKLGKPLIINSAYRDPDYNKSIGGATNSFHMRGMAFDISMANHNPAEFEAAAKEIGFRGIGHYPASNFMHIDTRPTLTRWTGTGANAKWFPSSTATTFSGNEPKKETLGEIVKKAQVVVPVAATAAGAAGSVLTPMVQGNGPFQYAFAAIAVMVVIGVGLFIWKQINRRSEI